VILPICILLAFGYACYNHFEWPDDDKITLFTSNHCGPGCDQARNWLNKPKNEIQLLSKNNQGIITSLLG